MLDVSENFFFFLLVWIKKIFVLSENLIFSVGLDKNEV